MKTVKGSCLCQQVAFEVTGEPLRFLYCHCRSCQKSTGSLHAANLLFPEGAVRWLRGEENIQRFVDEKENPGFTRCFCRNCGSFVPKTSRNGQFWVVPSGLLEEDPRARPAGNIYWSERAPWFVSAEDLVKHEEGWVNPDTAGR